MTLRRSAPPLSRAGPARAASATFRRRRGAGGTERGGEIAGPGRRAPGGGGVEEHEARRGAGGSTHRAAPRARPPGRRRPARRPAQPPTSSPSSTIVRPENRTSAAAGGAPAPLVAENKTLGGGCFCFGSASFRINLILWQSLLNSLRRVTGLSNILIIFRRRDLRFTPLGPPPRAGSCYNTLAQFAGSYWILCWSLLGRKMTEQGI